MLDTRKESASVSSADRQRSVFVAWIDYDGRSSLLAHYLGAEVHFISIGQRGKRIQAPIRYLIQAFRTWSVLRREKPNIIFVQSPPIFAILVVFIFSRLFGSQYVIDTHSSSFFSRTWGLFLPLHRLLSQHSLTTIVPSAQLGEIVKGWGCHSSVVGFTPGIFPVGEFPRRGDKFSIAVVCSFDPDEPTEALLESARALPDVNFYFTGNSYRANKNITSNSPANCTFTGYLPFGQYVGLLRGVDAVMDLTNWDNTLLLGAYEAVELGKPLITSDWPILRDYFPIGTVHVSNTVEGITGGIRRAQDNRSRLESEIKVLRRQLHASWDHEFRDLQQLLSEA